MPEEKALEIGYNTRLIVALGASAALVAILLWVRAFSAGSVLDWVFALVLTVVAVAAGLLVTGGRGPLLVADHRGVRVKIAGEWCGLPWVSISDYQVEGRRFPWADGHLLLSLHHSSHLVESLPERSRRLVSSSQRRRHAEVSVPLGAITGVSRGDERQLAGRLSVLAAKGGEGA